MGDVDEYIFTLIKISFDLQFIFFIKLITRQKKQVVFLSRQYNDISLNYAGVIDLLEEEGITYKCVCKKVLSSINDSVRTQGNYSNGQTFFKKIFKAF